MVSKHTYSLLSCVSLCFACHKDSFRSGSDAIKAGNQDLVFTCNADQKASNATQEVPGIGGKKVMVKGQFCHLDLKPEVQPLTVLFVVDFSGSMDKADPVRGGTCDRLEAANIIVNKLDEVVKASNGLLPVSIGALSFGTTAQPRPNGIKPMEQFVSDGTNARDMTAQNFCGNNAGGTNYQAAFREARNLLTSVQSKKLVIFLSDGLPTATSQEVDPVAQREGKAAADLLLSDLNIDLKIGYLNKNNSTASAAAAEKYLPTLVRNQNPDDVKVASNAEELIAKFQSIELPRTVSIEKSVGAQGIIKTIGLSDRTVNVSIHETSTPGVWDYETEFFELLGPANASTVNELTVTAKASDGTTPQSVIKIDFKRGI